MKVFFIQHKENKSILVSNKCSSGIYTSVVSAVFAFTQKVGFFNKEKYQLCEAEIINIKPLTEKEY